jgi:hypothetical protein
VIRHLLSAVALTAIAGCGSSSENARVEKCVDRLLSRAEPASRDDEGARDYARRTYCERFERNGWVYDDGAMSIAAQKWLDEGGTCAVGGEDMPTRIAPCDRLTRSDPILDCALLHHVRRREVRAYLQQLDRTVDVACDDGTPFSELGVP